MKETNTGSSLQRAAALIQIVTLMSACGGQGELIPIAGGEPDDSEFKAGGGVAQIHQALNDGISDRPAAAVIEVTVGSEQQVWVFACDNRNDLQRRVQDGRGRWGAWNRLASNCASVPSVGSWESTPNDTVFVYYKLSDNSLNEIRYASDGRKTTTNVSELSGYGQIALAPVFVGSNGAETRRGVAVTKPGALELSTIDYDNGSWTPHPVLNASGTIVFARAIPYASYAATTGYFLTAQVSSTAHQVFTRSSFASSFRAVNAPISDSLMQGRVTVGLVDDSCGDGCAIYRREDSVRYAPIRTSRWNWNWWDVGTVHIHKGPYVVPTRPHTALGEDEQGVAASYSFPENAVHPWGTQTNFQSAPAIVEEQQAWSTFVYADSNRFLFAGPFFPDPQDMVLQVRSF